MLERLTNLEDKVNVALKNGTFGGMSRASLVSLLEQIKVVKVTTPTGKTDIDDKRIDARGKADLSNQLCLWLCKVICSVRFFAAG